MMSRLTHICLNFFVYHKMYRRLDKGLLCYNDSVTYCDIDHDLVSEDVVDLTDMWGAFTIENSQQPYQCTCCKICCK